MTKQTHSKEIQALNDEEKQGYTVFFERPCPDCKATGVVIMVVDWDTEILTWDSCPTCNGRGWYMFMVD